MSMVKAGLALVAISLALYVFLIIYASPLRKFIGEKFGLSSWKEPPVFESKLTFLTSRVGDGLKKRFTLKKLEMLA
jgi:hypothetical protein